LRHPFVRPLDGGGASDFEPCLAVARIFAAFERPWFICGGWAIDLFVDRVTRGHRDVDTAVLRPHQPALQRQFSSWRMEKAVPGEGGRREAWRLGEELFLPVHELHFTRDEGYPREVEILLNESDSDVWSFRRDGRIELPLDMLGLRSSRGVPFLAPEVVLLYKAKSPRAIDEQDFAAVGERLSLARRKWLRGAIQLCHPGHPWLFRLM